VILLLFVFVPLGHVVFAGATLGGIGWQIGETLGTLWGTNVHSSPSRPCGGWAVQFRDLFLHQAVDFLIGIDVMAHGTNPGLLLFYNAFVVVVHQLGTKLTAPGNKHVVVLFVVALDSLLSNALGEARGGSWSALRFAGSFGMGGGGRRRRGRFLGMG